MFPVGADTGIALAANDVMYLEQLRVALIGVEYPPYGGAKMYTKGAAIFVDDKGVTTRIFTGLNQGGEVNSHYRDRAKDKHKNDAELVLLSKFDDEVYQNKKIRGTLYLSLSKGCCNSCRYVLKSVFKKFYTNVRVVIHYPENEWLASGALYGFETAIEYNKGFYQVL